MLHTLLPLKPYRDEIMISPLSAELRSAWSVMRRSPHWSPLAHEISSLVKQLTKPCEVDLSGDTIEIKLPAAMTPRGFDSLLQRLAPWRIGPYRIGSTAIDSEWRSFIKWQRILPLLGELSGTRVADIGCNSGYFMFKLAALGPQLLVGFDPIERCWLQSGLLQGLTRIPSLAFLPTGISTVDAFPGFFDLVLCMGVIYHQKDPFTACKKLFAATRPGGRVIIESLVVPQSGSFFLVPNDRYAKMRNAWVVPTPEALVTLIERAGFKNATLHNFGPITTEEQRRTPWAPYESLADFLDPNDSSKTIEGYPAPHSALVTAIKL